MGEPHNPRWRFLDKAAFRVRSRPWRQPRRTLLPALLGSLLWSSGSASGQVLQAPTNASPTVESFDSLSGLEQPALSIEGTPSDPLTPEQTRQLVDLVLYLLRANIPDTFVEDSEWGRQKKVYAGLRVKLDDGKLQTKRRWNNVNHGRWRRFSAELVNPEVPGNLRIEATNLRWDGRSKLQLQLNVDARLSMHARQSRWNYGVRLFSIHVDADAWLRLVLEGSVEVDVDYGKLPPDLVLRPHVQAADLQLKQFEVRRVGQVGGDIAEALGEASESILRRKVIEPQQRKLPEKINQQLDKKQDDLRLSVSDWLTEWLRTPSAND